MAEIDKERLLSHVRQEETRKVLSRVLDTVRQVLRDHKQRATDFLDPYHVRLAREILRGLQDITFHSYGGFSGAERERIAITPAYRELCPEDFQIAYGAAIPEGDNNLSHRDFLGSLLGTGIRREKVGDLLLVSGRCQFVADAVIFPFIAANWVKAGTLFLQVSALTPQEWVIPAETVQIVKVTVPSLRLDAIAAQGFGISRGKVAETIKNEKIRLNWCPVNNPSQSVAEGDLISYRGHGRIVVKAVKGETRKGRIFLELERYL